MLSFFPASMIGLDVIHSQVLSGDQLETMTEPQLDQIINNVSVFYRVTPRHKLSIVKVRFHGKDEKERIFYVFFFLLVFTKKRDHSRHDGRWSKRRRGPKKGRHRHRHGQNRNRRLQGSRRYDFGGRRFSDDNVNFICFFFRSNVLFVFHLQSRNRRRERNLLQYS